VCVGGGRVYEYRVHGAGTVTSDERYVLGGCDPVKPGAVGTENFDAIMDLNGSNAVTQRRVYGEGVRYTNGAGSLGRPDGVVSDGSSGECAAGSGQRGGSYR
jgi:hypothetical protein